MNPPNSKYNSGGVPHGGMFVDVYRPNDPENPNNGAIKLGRYLVESCDPTPQGNVTKRPNVDGGRNGWFIVEGDVEGPVQIQRSTVATPTLGNGDYFDANIFVSAVGGNVAGRWVLHGMSHMKDTGYRKQSGQVILDTFATGVAATDDNSPT